MDRRSYLHILEEQIRTKRARAMAVREVEDHIEDQKAAFLAEGMTEEEAEEAAVLEMGDPVEAGVALDRIHRPQMAWSVLAGVLLMSILGLALQMLVVMTAAPQTDTRVFSVMAYFGAAKHIAAIGAGIVLMLLICWMDYSFLAKHAASLWGLLHVLFILYMLTGSTVNGRPRYAAQFSCMFVPFYAGVLYHFRGQGKKGLLKSGACLLVPLCLLFYSKLLSSVAVTGICGLILLHVSIKEGWFGAEKGSLYLRLWAGIFATAFLILGVHMAAAGGEILADYQLERIERWIHPGKYEEYDMLRLMTVEAGEEAREGTALLEENVLSAVRNSYLWLYLFKYLGTARGMLLTAFVICFFALLFYTVHRQKNRLGYMVGLGCALFLSMQTVIYIGINFRLLPFTTAYMPFLSNGGAYLLISYFYMGILLSVCRNSRLVKN